jgi:MarR family transcriptional regulator, organic hydroperoxide resistance regulator
LQILHFDELRQERNNFWAMKTREHDEAIAVIQRCYPQIYLACHVRHIRAASTPHRLSARDSSLLVHLNPTHPMTASSLATHMGIGPSALSASIRRLTRLGYLRREKSAHDRRAASLTLTPQGAKAMSATSVLDPVRLAAVLDQLTDTERQRVLEGLQLLAQVCSPLRAIRQNSQNDKKVGKEDQC